MSNTLNSAEGLVVRRMHGPVSAAVFTKTLNIIHPPLTILLRESSAPILRLYFLHKLHICTLCKNL